MFKIIIKIDWEIRSRRSDGTEAVLEKTSAEVYRKRIPPSPHFKNTLGGFFKLRNIVAIFLLL